MSVQWWIVFGMFAGVGVLVCLRHVLRRDAPPTMPDPELPSEPGAARESWHDLFCWMFCMRRLWAGAEELDHIVGRGTNLGEGLIDRVKSVYRRLNALRRYFKSDALRLPKSLPDVRRSMRRDYIETREIVRTKTKRQVWESDVTVATFDPLNRSCAHLIEIEKQKSNGVFFLKVKSSRKAVTYALLFIAALCVLGIRYGRPSDTVDLDVDVEEKKVELKCSRCTSKFHDQIWESLAVSHGYLILFHFIYFYFLSDPFFRLFYLVLFKETFDLCIGASVVAAVVILILNRRRDKAREALTSYINAQRDLDISLDRVDRDTDAQVVLIAGDPATDALSYIRNAIGNAQDDHKTVAAADDTLRSLEVLAEQLRDQKGSIETRAAALTALEAPDALIKENERNYREYADLRIDLQSKYDRILRRSPPHGPHHV